MQTDKEDIIVETVLRRTMWYKVKAFIFQAGSQQCEIPLLAGEILLIRPEIKELLKIIIKLIIILVEICTNCVVENYWWFNKNILISLEMCIIINRTS